MFHQISEPLLLIQDYPHLLSLQSEFHTFEIFWQRQLQTEDYGLRVHLLHQYYQILQVGQDLPHQHY